MNKIFVNNIGDLAEAQRASFYRFLSIGISEELINFPNPFVAKIRVSGRKKFPCLVYLYPNEIKLKGPNLSLDTCIKRDMSYTIQLYVPGYYTCSMDPKGAETLEEMKEEEKKDAYLLSRFGKQAKTKRINVKQDVFFGEIPLMTEEGTFVISGCERIVISQIIRSPGIYFRKEFGTKRKTIYTATVISNKGLWTRFFLDVNEEKKKSKTI